eukprot:gene454-111_t
MDSAGRGGRRTSVRFLCCCSFVPCPLSPVSVFGRVSIPSPRSYLCRAPTLVPDCCCSPPQLNDRYSWGWNDRATLGQGHQNPVTKPSRVVGLQGVHIVQVAAGGRHAVALSNEYNQCDSVGGGRDLTVPSRWGAFHNLALTSSGAVFSWGINDYGQLGNGTTSNSKVPILVEGLQDVSIRDVACGGWHSVAVTDGGKIFVWGRGSFGRLGTGNEQNYFGPVEVELPGGPDRWWVITAAAGGRHSMCLAVPDNGDIGERLLGDAWERRGVEMSVTSLSASTDVSRGAPITTTPKGSAVKAARAASHQWSGSQDVSEGLH